MDRKQKYSLIALCVGVGAGLATKAWLFPAAAWWLHLVVGFAIAAGAYQGLLQQRALDKAAGD